MKQRITLPLALALLLTLTACGGGPADREGPASLEADRTFSRSGMMVCERENTVYAVVMDSDAEDSSGALFSMLYYFDKETGTSGPLCGKPECPHNDRDCNAHLGNGKVSALAGYSGRLCWIAGDSGGTKLYSVNYDGTDRQTVRKLDDGLLELGGVAAAHFYRGYVYLVVSYSTITDGEPRYGSSVIVYPIDSDGEGYMVLNEEAGFLPSIRIQLYGDSMYILTIDGGGAGNQFSFRKWNMETRELETLFDGAPSFAPGTAFWVTAEGIYLDGTVVGSHTVDAGGNDAWERHVYFYDFSAGEFAAMFPEDGSLGVSGGFSDNLFVTSVFRSDAYGNLPQGLVGQKLLDITVQGFDGQIILDTALNISEWPSGQVFLLFAGADEDNLYFYNSGTYLAVIPLDGGEPVIVWNGEL